VNFLELVRRRQSTRKYQPGRRIPREILERCLEAARLAPSACNSQPWSFVVVDDPEQVRALAAAACGHAPYGMNQFALDASALVAVVTEKMKLAARLGAHFRGVQYSLVDLGIAGEHLVLPGRGRRRCQLLAGLVRRTRRQADARHSARQESGAAALPRLRRRRSRPPQEPQTPR
jgi:nitroreductase